MTLVKLNFLGPFEARIDGETKNLTYQRATALLAYIAVVRHCSRQKVMGLLWPGATTQKAQANLRHAIHTIKKLGPILRTSRSEIALEPDLVELDLAQIGCDAEVFRGDFCEGISLDDSPDFDIWLLEQREHWRQRHGAGLQARATEALTHGDLDQAVQLSRALVHLDPLDSEAQTLLLKSLVADGQRQAAQRQLAFHKKILSEELGCEPPPEMQQLIPPPDVSPSNLPVTRDLFLGRDSELNRVSKLLKESRLVTILGPGGVGKTRLATECLHRTGQVITFVELAETRDPEETLGYLFRSLNLPVKNSELSLQTLGLALAGREGIMFFDNCEHIVDSIAKITDYLLSHCPNLSFLTTSREALKVRGERLFMVEPLDGESSLTLLLDRVRARKPEFEVDERDRPVALELCRQLDGLPLALELAASRLEWLDLRTLTSKLDHRFSLLNSGHRTDSPRQSTLQGLVDWSYELLESDLAERYLESCFLAASFELQTLQSLWRIDEFEAVETVEALCSRSLMKSERGRFTYLETMRLFGQHKSRQLGQENRHRGQILTYFRELAQSESHQKKWIEALDEHRSSLKQNLQWASMNLPKIALELTIKLDYFWQQRNLRSFACRILREALANHECRSLAPRAFRLLGSLLTQQAKYPQARAALERAHSCCLELEDIEELAWCVKEQGNAAFFSMDLETAKMKFREALEMFRKHSDSDGIEACQNNLGLLYLNDGENLRATSVFEDLLRDISPENLFCRGLAQSNLGYCWLAEGALDKSLFYFEQALENYAAVGGSKFGESYIKGGMAYNLCRAQRPKEAAQLLGEAESIWEEISAPIGPSRERYHQQTIEQLRDALGKECFLRERQKGYQSHEYSKPT